MKIKRSILACITIFLSGIACASYIIYNIETSVTNEVFLKQVTIAYREPIEKIVYEGMTLNELTDKLNRSLNSTLKDTGYLFAKKSIELGVDPYLAIAIVLHETGCNSYKGCSSLVNSCFNVGGQKGSPGCFNGSYRKFNSIEEGINSYLENLYYNYYSLGLKTPETIGPKYAASNTWASKINYYINYIKSN